MSRNPGYSRAGPNGGYANGNGSYNGGGYNGYGGGDGSYDGRPSGERARRPGGYGGMSAQQDDYPPRPSNERERPRRPGGYGGLAQEDEMERRPSGRPRAQGGWLMGEAGLQGVTRALARSHGPPASSAARRSDAAESARMGAAPGTQTTDRAARQSRRSSSIYGRIGIS